MDKPNEDSKNKLLEIARQQFLIYDYNAMRHQKRSKAMIQMMLSLNVIGTLFVVTNSVLPIVFYSNCDVILPSAWHIGCQDILKFIMILFPVASSFFYAITNRFSPGNKWMNLRSSAETVKSNIFRYRVRICLDSERIKIESQEKNLAESIKAINHKLMETQVNLSALHRKKEKVLNLDDLSPLTSEQYIELRINDQLQYFYEKTMLLEKQIKWLYILIYLFGGLGTILAAIGYPLWIAFTTSVSSTLITWLELQQVENNLIIFNQTSEELVSTKCWWEALTAEQKNNRKYILKLVDITECALQGEHSSWLRNTRFALSDLADLQGKKDLSNRNSQEQAAI